MAGMKVNWRDTDGLGLATTVTDPGRAPRLTSAPESEYAAVRTDRRWGILGPFSRNRIVMIEYRVWDESDVPSLVQAWYAMLEECGLLGSGVVADWQERLIRHFRSQMRMGTMRWFVAQEGSDIVGTAGAVLAHGGSYIFKDARATLAGIYVVPGYRNRGIARELTRRAVDWCKQEGCASIRLRASAAGRQLYASLGFVSGDEMVLTLR